MHQTNINPIGRILTHYLSFNMHDSKNPICFGRNVPAKEKVGFTKILLDVHEHVGRVSGLCLLWQVFLAFLLVFCELVVIFSSFACMSVGRDEHALFCTVACFSKHSLLHENKFMTDHIPPRWCKVTVPQRRNKERLK